MVEKTTEKELEEDKMEFTSGRNLVDINKSE